jgi:hypothetical protein
MTSTPIAIELNLMNVNVISKKIIVNKQQMNKLISKSNNLIEEYSKVVSTEIENLKNATTLLETEKAKSNLCLATFRLNHYSYNLKKINHCFKNFINESKKTLKIEKIEDKIKITTTNKIGKTRKIYIDNDINKIERIIKKIKLTINTNEVLVKVYKRNIENNKYDINSIEKMKKTIRSLAELKHDLPKIVYSKKLAIKN